MSPEELMQAAIAVARRGISAGQSPFGCAIADGDKLLAQTHNTVAATTDITAHAEINGLRAACGAAGSIFLAGTTVATTCEPCPMCMAALHWARVETVYFGASIDDAARAGFNELTIPAMELLTRGGSRVKLVGYVLQDECAQLFDEWLANPDRVSY